MMRPGDFVRIRRLSMHTGGHLYSEYDAPPGETIVMMYLGTERDDGERLNPLEVLADLGCRRVQAGAPARREVQP